MKLNYLFNEDYGFDDLDDELNIERNIMNFLTEKEYGKVVVHIQTNRSIDSEDYKKLVHATQLLKNISNSMDSK